MKISEYPHDFVKGSAHVRLETTGNESRPVVMLVESAIVDADGKSHYTVKEFGTYYGTHSVTMKNYSESADLAFIPSSSLSIAKLLGESEAKVRAKNETALKEAASAELLLGEIQNAKNDILKDEL